MSLSGYSLPRFITSDDCSPLDHSHVHVQLIAGSFVYSPNSQRNVHLLPVYDDIPYRDCFKDNFAEFCQPLWWQPACPYLAFMPLQPVFAGVPFQDLFHISYFPHLPHAAFMIDPQIILGWAHLERNIKDAVELLLSHEHAPPITWIAPTSIGCTSYFRRVHDLHAFLHTPRNSFLFSWEAFPMQLQLVYLAVKNICLMKYHIGSHYYISGNIRRFGYQE